MEAGYQAAGLDFRYINCEVSPAGLGDAVRGAVAMGWRGFNCSLPHKVAIMSYLDHVAPSASIIGAVNTVIINSDGHLTGENTDGQGFTESLASVTTIGGASITLFGAGGAARAIAVECALAGAASITVVNRTEQSGTGLAHLIAHSTPAQSTYAKWTPNYEIESTATVVINATSIGFSSQNERLSVAPESVSAEMVVADVVANPPLTPWLRQAQERGATTLTGLGMLVNQAAINGRLWTGADLNRTVMHTALEQVFALR